MALGDIKGVIEAARQVAAEFLKWNNPLSNSLELPVIILGISRENLKLVSHQYKAWSDSKEAQNILALYWWQRLTTFGPNKILVNVYMIYN